MAQAKENHDSYVQHHSGSEGPSTRTVIASAAVATSPSSQQAVSSSTTPNQPQQTQNQGQSQTLGTVTVTPVGFFLNPAEEQAVRKLTLQDVQRGKDAKSETAVMLGTSGKMLKRTQNGCRGHNFSRSLE